MFLWVCGHLIYITIDGLTDKKMNADIAVVLGNKVNEDGTLSERLEKRMECGLNLYNSGRVKKILVSGGLGKEGFYEGDKMKEYLIKHNVPDSVIIVDNLGSNTLATVTNTPRWCERHARTCNRHKQDACASTKKEDQNLMPVKNPILCK